MGSSPGDIDYIMIGIWLYIFLHDYKNKEGLNKSGNNN